MIYMAQPVGEDRVKIGWSENPVERARSLQTSNHKSISLIRVIEAPRWGERWLHREFIDYHVHLEWFNFHEKMLTVEIPELEPIDLAIWARPWGKVPSKQKSFMPPVEQFVVRLDSPLFDEMEKARKRAGQVRNIWITRAIQAAIIKQQS